MARCAADGKLINTKQLAAGSNSADCSLDVFFFFSFAHIKAVIKFQVHLPFRQHILHIPCAATTNEIEFSGQGNASNIVKKKKKKPNSS